MEHFAPQHATSIPNTDFLNKLNMPSASKEARVILALEAIKDNLKIGIRAAAKLYNVPASTLCRRRGG